MSLIASMPIAVLVGSPPKNVAYGRNAGSSTHIAMLPELPSATSTGASTNGALTRL